MLFSVLSWGLPGNQVCGPGRVRLRVAGRDSEREEFRYESDVESACYQ